MHKSLKRNNITRVLIQSLLKPEILFLLKCNQNLSLTITIMDLTEYMKLLTLMLKLNHLALQMLNLRLFHYNKSQNARDAFQQINFGVVIILLISPRKQRKVRKKQNARSRVSGQPVSGQPDVASQTTLPVYRTQYGRAVKPPK